jgi:signal transduction histidine kinase
MIQKARIKLIILTMSSLLILLAVIVTGMNIINYHSVVSEADEVLSILSRNQGVFPDYKDTNSEEELPHNMSPELPYESRFFSVLLDSSGNVIQTETDHILTINASTAEEYALLALESNLTQGFIENFRFIRYSEGSSERITFLDYGRKLEAFRRFLYASMGMSAAGFIIIFIIVIFYSSKIIYPIEESHKKQKRFITDAGHEIKTPLTIINANVDVLEMEIGENECLTDIHQQTKRLTSLTNDLIYLARMEESDYSIPMIEFPISEIVYETTSSFKVLAQNQGKELTWNVQPALFLKGNDHAIEKLVSTLMNNALKYSSENGSIFLELIQQNKNLLLAITNTTESPISDENLQHIFDRFYRIDSSHNSETGGHGIGLSLAKAIVTEHRGKINAKMIDEHTFKITVTLPIKNN